MSVKPAMHIYACIYFVGVYVCVFVHACEGKCVLWERGTQRRGPQSAVCRSVPSLRGSWVGVWGHVGPVCGNPALLTSHTLFSCSYKPLMPQKMLSLLWPGTDEGGGQWGGGRRGRRGLVGSLVWLPPFLSSSILSPLCSHPLLFWSFLFSLHSVLPLSPSQEDLAWLDLAADAYHTKELNQLKFKLSLLVRYC